MEDGPNGVLSDVEVDFANNGVVSPIMANFLEGTVAEPNEDAPKINGDATPDRPLNQDDYSSESDALIIDESATKNNKQRKRLLKPKPTSPRTGGGGELVSHHFNPYFNESLFELTQQHHEPASGNQLSATAKFHKKRLKNKNSPKLREYAQYLGLQPTVQFKCSRCGRAGFESLTTLNEHIVQCTDEPSTQPAQVQDGASSSFKLTRKVFLCSACGTYYENWNLYLHMIEVHRRYLCLYCLGMFSVLDDLCLHIQSRHNFEPGYKETVEEFFSAYSEPCYVVCCGCSKIFNERDNFFYHTCTKPEIANKSSKVANNQKVASKPAKTKQLILPEDHVTGDSSQIGGDCDDQNGGKQLTVPEIPQIDPSISENLTEDQSTEIVYSSDSELDFLGFDSGGEPAFLNKNNDTLNQSENSEGKELDETMEEESVEVDEPVETRKVPKLSLKLKPGSFPEIESYDNSDDDDDRLLNELIESETEINEVNSDKEDPAETTPEDLEPQIQIAGADISIIELQLEQPLDKFDIRLLLQKCLNATVPNCIYCNHARKIAVNGKSLGLHAIAQHRYSAIVSSITAEELIPESFVARIKESLDVLETVYFNLESGPSDEAVTFSHIFECFQCRYATAVHKELYMHNRKSHAKNLLLCIMCKSNFYSYSELICHLCPGVYILDYDVQFRCCMCVSDDIPSAFRLLVHLRKRHHVCDVCLEMCHSQHKLSTHVWKHKLHHFCYRCGIAYRNKPDITRHLFWKHGTESVLCKKCLQKKWPHVYHFCVPPISFVCEECNLTFSRAVSLKVHKRLHSDEKPHACTVEDCQERFISKKLLEKHELRHREPPEEPKPEVVEEVKEESDAKGPKGEEETEKVEEKKPKVDVYDLPALNLSESDSSDSEPEMKEPPEVKELPEEDKIEEVVVEDGKDLTVGDEIIETIEESTPILEESTEVVPENIWDDFKNYQASKEKFDHLLTADKGDVIPQPSDVIEEDKPLTLEKVLRDHDYCVDPNNKPDVSFTEVKPDLSQSVDHDYCSSKDPALAESSSAAAQPTEENNAKSPKKRTNSSSSDSSSDSDSSSCSCGPNCSCSSSSGSSSSTSDSSNSDSSTEEGRKRQQARRDRRRQRSKNKTTTATAENRIVDVVATDQPPLLMEIPIQESDLETTESETDEEFYDKQPQLFAKKIMEEKRNQLLAGIEGIANGSLMEASRTSTPNLPEEVKKKKSKSKKKKKKKSLRKELERQEASNIPNSSYYQYYYQPPTVAPITLSLSRNSPVPSPSSSAKLPSSNSYLRDDLSREDADSSLRASKRRRVPNKFYGYSSDEEDSVPKWRKSDVLPVPPQHSSMVVPPITIKAGPPPVQPFTIRPTALPGQMKVHKRIPPIRLKPPPLPPPRAPPVEDGDSEADSNSSNEGRNLLGVNPDALYCYCKCPYDEVSEMIGCDSRDCSIEWFHFECVGIMVPPKGHWYCPECRKKRQQKRDVLKLKTKAAGT